MPYIDRYHANMNIPWRRGVDLGKNKKLVGIEFEHEFLGNVNRDALVEEVERDVNSENYKWLPERDGSLAEGRSVEFVSDPLPYNYVFHKKGIFRKLTELLKERSPDERNSGVGQHVNINISYLTKEQQAKALHFLNWSRTLGIAIGGRESHFAPYRYRHSSYAELMRGFNPYKLAAAWIPAGIGDHVTSQRMEVRLARSSTDWMKAAIRTLYPISVVSFVAEENIPEENLHTSPASIKALNKQYFNFLQARRSKGVLLPALKDFIRDNVRGIDGARGVDDA